MECGFLAQPFEKDCGVDPSSRLTSMPLSKARQNSVLLHFFLDPSPSCLQTSHHHPWNCWVPGAGIKKCSVLRGPCGNGTKLCTVPKTILLHVFFIFARRSDARQIVELSSGFVTFESVPEYCMLIFVTSL